MITIEQDEYALTAAPDLGGAVMRLTWRGHDLLRPTPAATTDIFATATFALAPFANRIAFGAFTFEGRAVRLKLNHGDHPHALHGHGFQRPWRVDYSAPDRVRMSYDYAPGDWPWAYRCSQELALDAQGFLHRLTIENHAASPMPASLGFHPYFERPRGVRLAARVDGEWRIDETILPTEFTRALDLPGLPQGTVFEGAPFIDNCYTGWDGAAHIAQSEREIVMTASPEMTFFHLFLPLGESFFCAEPVTAMPDAVNRRDVAGNGLKVLAPGETFSVWMRLEARAL